MPAGMGDKTRKRTQEIYTLLVQVGRSADDGLPEGASGAGILCYSSGVDEAEAVRETVKLLKQAGLAPLDVTGYGTLGEREKQGHEVGEEERMLMKRALEENAVIVAEMTPIYEEDRDDSRLS